MLANFTILCYILSGCNQTGTTDTIKSTSFLYQYWIHSYEEDNNSGEYKIYRPDSYPFPPARSRDGFEIKKSGTFVSHPIASADNKITIKEKWKLSEHVLIITGKTTTRRFTILHLSKEKLALQPM